MPQPKQRALLKTRPEIVGASSGPFQFYTYDGMPKDIRALLPPKARSGITAIIVDRPGGKLWTTGAINHWQDGTRYRLSHVTKEPIPETV